ncbi:chromosomal replication initiator protein DnaA [Microgenomates group bacterium RBG_16_45_19]|nr:MAG: chromosomal replication initiator protein DnaA [Microgenomates group bacterium RBG_16_45_19]
MEVKQMWKIVFEDLQVSMSSATFSSWIKPLSLQAMAAVGESRLIADIVCPSPFHINIVEQRYYAQIKDAFDRATDKQTELRFSVGATPVKTTIKTPLGPLFKTAGPNNGLPTMAMRRVGLRKDFNFDSFAVSTTNEMAHAAAKAVKDHFGAAYNPLFIYGGVGVGKTHLMQAIAQARLYDKPQTTMIYCMGEEFTNEIIDAIQQKTTRDFKKRYRLVKGLFIDDIQFIAGKTTVQEEFFHTFNAILKGGGQVVLTSDKPPQEIPQLEARLKSRFEAGLIVDIGEPDFELRTAITLIKAKQRQIPIGMAEAQLIAGNIESARKIEGFLVKLATEAQIRKHAVDNAMIQGMLGKESRPTEGSIPPLRPNEIIRGVAKYFDLPAKEITGSGRAARLVLSRHTAMYLMRIDYNLPLTEIGYLFSNRDHTTVMHAVNKITLELKNSSLMRTTIGDLRQQLYASYKA